MTKKQKQPSSKLVNGLPAAPWIFINNSLNTSNVYADALSDFIPQSRVYEALQPLTSLYEGSEPHAVSIWAHSTAAHQAADIARGCQVKALRRGCNVASVALCNDSTFSYFLAVNESAWPINHITINIDETPIEEVAKRIVRWLFTVLSVRETLHLIPESEMLAVDTKHYADYKYCALKEVRTHCKSAKIQFVALIASRPELTEPKRLSWKVVDRSGEAKFYFHHRGPTSQLTWDWVLSLKVGDRKVLPRMPMVALHEPIAKKILLSPLRATGATIRGVGHVTMGLGNGMHWVGEKVSIRRSEEQKYMREAEWEEREEETRKRTEASKRMKEEKKQRKVRARDNAVVRSEGSTKEKEKNDVDFKIFNEEGEKTWKDVEDDVVSSVAGSLVDEKVEKEFC